MQTQQQTPKQPGPPRKRRTGLLVAAIAVVVVLIVGAVALLSNGSDSDLAPTDAPSTPTTLPAETDTEGDTTDALSTSTTVPADTSVSTSDALAISDAFFVAYNAGDVDAVMALFAPEATFSANVGPNTDRDDIEMLYTWNAAQGTTLTTEACTAQAGDQGDVSVRCSAANLGAIAQAVTAPPVPETIYVTVTADGITTMFRWIGEPDFEAVGQPFEAWMKTNNPADAANVEFGAWNTIEEAAEYGELTARYAAEWATYLADNNCSYKDGC